MNLEILLKYMVFMMSVFKSMETQMYGNTWQMYLICCLLLLLLIMNYFVYMEDFHPMLWILMIFSNWIDDLKYLLKDLYVIYYGQILQIVKGLVSLVEVLVLFLVRIRLWNLVILIKLKGFIEPINCFRRVFKRLMILIYVQFLVLLIIVIDVITRLLLFRYRKII